MIVTVYLQELPQLPSGEIMSDRIETRFSGELAIICPSIICTPGVCGGAARIAGTRIPVWQLWQNHNSGVSDEQISEAFGIDLATLKSVWQYCELNSESLNNLVEANKAA